MDDKVIITNNVKLVDRGNSIVLKPNNEGRVVDIHLNESRLNFLVGIYEQLMLQELHDASKRSITEIN